MNSKPQKAAAVPYCSGRTVFLLGKPVRDNSLFPELFARLKADGREVHVHLPHESGIFFPAWARADDLFLHRGLFPGVLAALHGHEQNGLRFYNRVAATQVVLNRLELHQRLDQVEIPVPSRQKADHWHEVLELCRAKNLMVKAVHGFIGRGAGVVRLNRQARRQQVAQAPFAGPYLLEERIANDGWDRKLYVVGRECRGLLKKWPREEGRPAQPFTPEAGLADLAVRAGQVLGLEIYGADFIIGPVGPVLVDVNPFPSFKGIPEAAGLIANYLRRHG